MFVRQILVLIVLRRKVDSLIWLMLEDLHIEAFQINILSCPSLLGLHASPLPRFHIFLSAAIITLILTIVHQVLPLEIIISFAGFSECPFVTLIPFELFSIVQPYSGLFWFIWPLIQVCAIQISFRSLRDNLAQVLVVSRGTKRIL